MNNFLNVLIVGANFSNKGAEAMLKTVQQEFLLRNPNFKFFLLCREYEEQLAKEAGFTPVFEKAGTTLFKAKNFIKRASGKIYKIITGKNKPFYFPFPFTEIRKTVKKADVIVDISGFAYGDSWGTPMTAETIKLMKFTKGDNSKYFFLPQAWGSFNDEQLAVLTRDMLGRAEMFYARDTVSQKYIAGALHKEPDSIPLLPDIALNYKGIDEELGNTLLQSVGYSKNEKTLIGISPNFRVYERSAGRETENEYLKTLISLCNYCINKLDANVLIIPNEIIPDGVDIVDDRYLCKLIHTSVNNPGRCFAITTYCSSEQIKSVVAKLDFLISSRFHALIFGISQKIPVMAISWSHKYRELFSLFGIEEYVLENNNADKDAIVLMLNKLMNEKNTVKQKIAKQLPVYQAKVTAMFDEIVGSLKK